jgi:hypothetical protein
MPSTRASARRSSSPKNEEAAAGSKRKAVASSPKGSRKAAKQTTIEESLAGADTMNPPDNPDEDAEMKETPTAADDKNNGEEHARTEAKLEDEAKIEETDLKNGGNHVEKTEAKNEDPVQESSQRKKKIASNILEKGIVYFFTRNRVGIEDSDSVGDLARTYFVLRPLPLGTELGQLEHPFRHIMVLI